MNYAEMTLEQLEEKNESLMNQKQQIIKEQRQLKAIIEQQIANRKAEKTLEAMSDSERQALRQRVLKQTINPDAIESKEIANSIQ